MPQLTILFAELAHRTQLYLSRGDTAAHREVVTLVAGMSDAVRRHGGTLGQTVGDTLLATFKSADQAVLAAVELQVLHAGPPLRVGFHSGEVLHDGPDVYGSVVNVAARVTSFARADEIFTTQASVNQMSAWQRRLAEPFDRIAFKGVAEPQAVYRIRWTAQEDATGIVLHEHASSHQDVGERLLLQIGLREVFIDALHPVVTLGRDADQDVAIHHVSTSRRHASIHYRKGGFVLRDSSTNGTWVVQEQVAAQRVRRSEQVLGQYGVLGLGWIPTEHDDPPLAFRQCVSGVPGPVGARQDDGMS